MNYFVYWFLLTINVCESSLENAEVSPHMKWQFDRNNKFSLETITFKAKIHPALNVENLGDYLFNINNYSYIYNHKKNKIFWKEFVLKNQLAFTRNYNKAQFMYQNYLLKIPTLSRFLFFNLILFFLLIILIDSEILYKLNLLSVIFFISISVITSIITHISFSVNSKIFYVYNNINNKFILLDLVVNNQLTLNNEQNIFNTIEKNINYYMYKIKPIFSPIINIIYLGTFLFYIGLQLFVLITGIDLPNVICLQKQQDIDNDTYDFLYIFKLIIDFFIIIFNLMYWFLLKDFQNVMNDLYANLVINSGNNIFTYSLIKNFIKYFFH